MPTDADLIRASRRDPAAFGAVFDRHWVRIHRYCVGRAGPPGEDLAAETFRVAFSARRRYDRTQASAAPWLYGIATNLLRGALRGSARERGAFARSAPAPGEGDATDATIERIEAERLGPELARALAGLSATERETLLVHVWADLSYEEVARALGVPVGTVRSRIHRARARVRAHLETLESHR